MNALPPPIQVRGRFADIICTSQMRPLRQAFPVTGPQHSTGYTSPPVEVLVSTPHVADNALTLTQRIVFAHRRRHRRLGLMRAPVPNNPNWFDFHRLNSLILPGLTADQFFDLFTQCRCGLIMTRSVFPRHHCRHTVIDLTQETDEDDETVVDLTEDA